MSRETCELSAGISQSDRFLDCHSTSDDVSPLYSFTQSVMGHLLWVNRGALLRCTTNTDDRRLEI
jgi:hypothetical protein